MRMSMQSAPLYCSLVACQSDPANGHFGVSHPPAAGWTAHYPRPLAGHLVTLTAAGQIEASLPPAGAHYPLAHHLAALTAACRFPV